MHVIVQDLLISLSQSCEIYLRLLSKKILVSFNSSESPDVLVGSYTSIWESAYCFWQWAHCTILHGHCLALCASRSFRGIMVTLQSGHGITLKGQTLQCRCERQKKRQKSINSMLRHLSQLRHHKHKKHSSNLLQS